MTRTLQLTEGRHDGFTVLVRDPRRPDVWSFAGFALDLVDLGDFFGRLPAGTPVFVRFAVPATEPLAPMVFDGRMARG